MNKSESDTQLGLRVSETQIVSFALGGVVRVTEGALKGATGRVVERRGNGRWLICIHRGVFAEVADFVLESIEPKSR